MHGNVVPVSRIKSTIGTTDPFDKDMTISIRVRLSSTEDFVLMTYITAFYR